MHPIRVVFHPPDSPVWVDRCSQQNSHVLANVASCQTRTAHLLPVGAGLGVVLSVKSSSLQSRLQR
ncbi:hypothetical protein SynBIOSU31_02995 [Synechococcus sp. BIOS-U3-1]|nr:hypothetical protein SynBIOSU31_02995 [Synechococcus sp. BIOS-U3-1]